MHVVLLCNTVQSVMHSCGYSYSLQRVGAKAGLWTLDSGLDSWTEIWTDAQGDDDHFQGWCKTWTLDSGLDSWTGLWTEIWTRFWTDALCDDDHFQQ